jgi:EAL domain-containing protein (putative c-di-GMP-specific phosphodiesterase class I)
LIRRAGHALRAGKKTGTPVVVHEGEPELKSARRLVIAGALRHSIEHDLLTLVAQPKVDVVTRRICGAELLARWHHPELGTISPGEFIPLAEQTGLIRPLTYWVMSSAAKALRTLEKDGVYIPLAVNISTRNLYEAGFVARVQSVCGTWGISPERLHLELTETALMHDPDAALKILTVLRDLGFEIHIDDFGAGYSSLGYLQKLPIDCVKIDRMFVTSMSVEDRTRNIVRLATDLAHDLGLKVIAEGVETLTVLEDLAEIGCDMAQGYFIAKPMPLDDFALYAKTANGVFASEEPG